MKSRSSDLTAAIEFRKAVGDEIDELKRSLEQTLEWREAKIQKILVSVEARLLFLEDRVNRMYYDHG